MVRSPRIVFGRAGCRLEENHRRRSWEARAHVLPTVAYGTCRACGLDERHHPSQLFRQPRVLAGSDHKGVYAAWLAPPSPHRALEITEIPGIVEDYRKAAERAKAASFDGVELHAANGYLPDQFLQDGINKRTDMYGGSIENRSRFLLQVVEALVSVWGDNRVAVRIAPSGTWNGVSDSNPIALFDYVAKQLNHFGLAYLHIIEPRIKGTC